MEGKERQEVLLRERNKNELMNLEIQALFEDGEARVRVARLNTNS